MVTPSPLYSNGSEGRKTSAIGTLHRWYVCGDACEGCKFCEGGLMMCVVCKQAEVELTEYCPGPRPELVARCSLPGFIKEADFDAGENYLYLEEENRVIIYLPRLDYLDNTRKDYRPGVMLSRTDFRALFCRTNLTRAMYEA